MDKQTKIYGAVLLIFIIGFLYLQSVQKKPIDWSASYVSSHKKPYGTYILKQELPNLFPETTIEEIKISPYVFLKDSVKNGTYIFINDKLNFDDAEFLSLMKFVEKGNDVFIATSGIEVDTLKVKTKPLLTTNFKLKQFLKFSNVVFKGKEYYFDRATNNHVFVKADTINTTVLGFSGYINENNKRTEQGINFIKQAYGNGNFYFYMFPEAFINYTLLQSPNQQIAANVLSYVNKDVPIFLDAYYKTGKSKISSPMHYILTSESLKWAYYFLLIGVVIFILFEGKRKQRSIPVITPLKNQTIAYVKTISALYFEKKSHKTIAEHQINYLYDFVRTQLHVPTVLINNSFYEFVAARSNNSKTDVIELFSYCEKLHNQNTITEEELIKLNKLIEKFKSKNTYG